MKVRVTVLALLVDLVGLTAAAALAWAYPEVQWIALLMASVATSTAMALMDAPAICLMCALGSDYGCGYGECVTASEICVAAGAASGPLACTYLIYLVPFGLELNLTSTFLVLGLLSAAIAFAGSQLRRAPLDEDGPPLSPTLRVAMTMERRLGLSPERGKVGPFAGSVAEAAKVSRDASTIRLP